MDPQFVKRETKSISPSEIGRFIESACGSVQPKVTPLDDGQFRLNLADKEISNFFDSLPTTKRKLRYVTF